jgi:hypothetical protein
MSKKLEKSELENVKELLDSQTKNFIGIGQKKQQIKVLEAQINCLVNDNLQSEQDYAKYIEKYKNKYGDFQSIKIENGELNFKNEEKK